MEQPSKGTSQQDWLAYGLRWVVVLVILFGTLLVRRNEGFDLRDAAAPLLITAVINGVIAALMLVPSAQKIIPFALIAGDWALAGAAVTLSNGNPLLIVGFLSLILIAGELRLGALLGTVEAAGVIASVIVVPYLATRQPPTIDTSLFFLLIAIAVVGAAYTYIVERQVTESQKAMQEMASSRSAQVADLQERSRAIYEMASMLSGTLNYQKILDAMLDIGRVAQRDKPNQRIVSAVLLYRAGDNALTVATSRGMRHTDENRILKGVEGVVGDALKECMPVAIAKNAEKDPELGTFTAFAGCKSALAIPLRAGYDNYGVLVYGSDQINAFTEEHTELLTAISTQATIALQNAVLYGNLLKEKERIVEVEEDARKKLARDLHDGPTQTISAIAMRMSYIYRLLERTPQEVPGELKKVEELARNTTKEIRNLLFGLRPLVLESQGLAAALEQLAEKMRDTYGQAVAVRVARDVEGRLTSHQQGTIFYIVEEAVNNARKHAKAELISVTLQRRDEANFVVQIADNGVGFDMGAVDANYDKRGSLGMVNMRERTEIIDGTLRMESAEGKGTKITIIAPFQNGANANGNPAAGRGTKLAAAARQSLE
jgi:signal transduction histidine kinase